MARPKKVINPDIINEPLNPTPEEIQVKVVDPVLEQKIEENVPAPIATEVVQQKPPEAEKPPTVYEVEREGESGAISARKLPNINSGMCEFCGGGVYDHSSPQRLIEDWTVQPETQKGRCEHYKNITIRCSYCPINANWADNIRTRKHMVWVSPWNDKQLIICCADMNCRDKHMKRAMGGRM